MATVVFIGDGTEQAYVTYDPSTQIKYRFVEWGKEWEVPEAMKNRLIKTFPTMFGETQDAIYQARGIEPPEKVAAPKKRISKKKPSTHPTTKALQAAVKNKTATLKKRKKRRVT